MDIEPFAGAFDAAVEFFYDRAGYAWSPASETEEEGRTANAHRLARAELEARGKLSFAWQVDVDVDSSDFSDEKPPWQLWQCNAYDDDNEIVASLSGVDLGRNGHPDNEPYARVVQAEVARAALY